MKWLSNLWEPSWEELLLCSCNILIQFDFSCSSRTHFHLIKTDFGSMENCKKKNWLQYLTDLATKIIEDESWDKLNMAYNIIGSRRAVKKSAIRSPNFSRKSKSLRIHSNYLLNIRSLWPFFCTQASVLICMMIIQTRSIRKWLYFDKHGMSHELYVPQWT